MNFRHDSDIVDWQTVYPCLRNCLAYGLGLTSVYEAREQLGPTTPLAHVDGVVSDDIQQMTSFVKDLFGFAVDPFAERNSDSLSAYLAGLVASLETHGISLQHACIIIERALPGEWIEHEAMPSRGVTPQTVPVKMPLNALQLEVASTGFDSPPLPLR